MENEHQVDQRPSAENRENKVRIQKTENITGNREEKNSRTLRTHARTQTTRIKTGGTLVKTRYTSERREHALEQREHECEQLGNTREKETSEQRTSRKC